MTLTVPEPCDRPAPTSAPSAPSAPALAAATAVDTTPASSPASASGQDPSAAMDPVTITHFQQAENGTLERKTVPEVHSAPHNPFRNSPAASPALRVPTTAAPSPKNPFASMDHHQHSHHYHASPLPSNNPFLLRLASPILNNRTGSPTIHLASDPPIVDATEMMVSLKVSIIARSSEF